MNYSSKKVISFLFSGLILVSCMSKEEQKNAAEEASKFAVEKKARIAKGVGEGLKGEGKDAAESVSEGVGEVVKGIEKGFDKSLAKVKVNLSNELKEYLELGRSGMHFNDSLQLTEISVYLIFINDFQGTLVLKAFDDEEAEIGRMTVKISEKSGEAGYVNFKFDERTPITLTEYYTLEMKK